ncbi:hypothetical protein WMF39_44415 [Sorangium sp. So ce1504]|uniref:hypothetical protein n=1 Tax=Sorangium sp. So ce1504 TaxID=3133337 RepID=UPI003F5DD7D2
MACPSFRAGRASIDIEPARRTPWPPRTTTKESAESTKKPSSDKPLKPPSTRELAARAMKMLEKLARRVNALKEDDRDLPRRWKLLLDFLGTFRQGGAKRKAAPAEPAAAVE